MKYYIVSGGFDPLHEGHISLIKASREESDGVIVLLNSDAWLCRKKGKNFMSYETRKVICENLKGVEAVIGFDDGLSPVRYDVGCGEVGDSVAMEVLQVEGPISLSGGSGLSCHSAGAMRMWSRSRDMRI